MNEITTEYEYEAALAEVEELMNQGQDNAAIEALADTIINYEAIHYPIRPFVRCDECKGKFVGEPGRRAWGHECLGLMADGTPIAECESHLRTVWPEAEGAGQGARR